MSRLLFEVRNEASELFVLFPCLRYLVQGIGGPSDRRALAVFYVFRGYYDAFFARPFLLFFRLLVGNYSRTAQIRNRRKYALLGLFKVAYGFFDIYFAAVFLNIVEHLQLRLFCAVQEFIFNFWHYKHVFRVFIRYFHLSSPKTVIYPL